MERLASTKGPPQDKTEDLEHPVWAGIISLNMQSFTPQQIEDQNNLDLPGLTSSFFNK